ncbi:MAG: aldo/keto reductase [Spirochaetia bacterium]|jgi:aryl-alcohol dehydrogenase-like predicted oxidoreductase
MEKRALGTTGLQVSVLGFGGFHLVEIPSADAARLLGTYLDNGGSYIETAAGYGDGKSELKIGAAVSHRRAEYALATKSTERTRAGFLSGLERSLRNLKTDHVDLMFMHAVQTEAEADAILGPGGAMEGAEEARKAGKLRYVAISGHGRPDGLLHAVKLHRFDALMTVFNYFDRFNFPTVENDLVPLCRQRGTGLIAMKAFGDGYLHKSPVPAFRYALSMPVATVVAGINSDAMLNADFSMLARFTPMTDAEKEEIFRTAPELGDYVCRLCGKCRTGEFDPQSVFLLEAAFDRQMDDMRVGDSAHYALRERLKQWFQQHEVARKEYAVLKSKVNPGKDYSALSKLCPYGIDVDRKLKIAHEKLSADGSIA